MDTLQSVEEFLVLTQPINATQGDTIEDLTVGELAFLDADCYNVLSSLANKNKVFIAMRYSEDDIRITEWQIKNTKSMTYHTARPNHCAIKSFMIATTLGLKDTTAISDSAAGNILLNDYFVRLHITNPLAENTLAYNETIMVPAGTRLHKLTDGLNNAKHIANVQATVLIGFMKQLIQRSKNLDASFKPYLCDTRDLTLVGNPMPTISFDGAEFKSANIWDETNVNYGLVANDISNYAIVLTGGYDDISLSVYGVHNKAYRKRRMYNISITAEDYQYSFGHVNFAVPSTFTREPQEAIGAGVDLQRVELFDSGNFDKWGTPNYVSTIDGEPFDFNFKTDHQKSYIQYIIEAFNEDINGESRIYRHPVQWRLLVPTDDNTAAICASLETILDTLQGVDLMFRSTEITPRNEDVVNIRTLSVLPEIKISRTNIESIIYDRTEQFDGDSIGFSVVFATGYPDLKTLTFNGINISAFTGTGTALNPLLFSITVVDGDNELVIETGQTATILDTTSDVNVTSVTENPNSNLFVGDTVEFSIIFATGHGAGAIMFNGEDVVDDFDPLTGKLEVVLTTGPNEDGQNVITVTAITVP